LTHLVKSLSERRVKVGLPTPVIAEYLIGVGADKQSHFAQLQSSAPFLPLPFDEKAAIEHACITEPDVKPDETKAKLRFDRQVIAISKAHGADRLYTADGNQAEFAKGCGLPAVLMHEIPLPPPVTGQLFEPAVGNGPTSSPSEPEPPS
jgi:hypothetical protein